MTNGADEAAIRQAISEHRRRFNSWDKAGWLDLFVENPSVEEPVGSQVRIGREVFAANMDALQNAGMEIPEFDAIVVCGREAAVTMTLQVGESSVPIVELFSFDDNARISGTRVFMPPLDQLGL
jgi:steroid Delta-isomerase